MSSETLRGQRQKLTAAAKAIMWMPGGVQTITLDKGGKAHTITVQVDRDTASTMQRDLEGKLTASEHRPFFDFAHDEKLAAAWPTSFEWRDEPPGVYATVEWSDSGLKAVDGKDYRAFSPAFYANTTRGTPDKPARVTGAPMSMGGLVNDPAFKTILPLWARAGAPSTHNNRRQYNMTDTELAKLQAKRTELAESLETLKATNTTPKQDLADAEAELYGIDLQIENAKLQAKVAKQEEAELKAREANAEALVLQAVASGQIPSRDEAMRAEWKKLLTDDPSKAVLLAARPHSPALAYRRATQHASIETGQEDIRDALHAYACERNPRERGKLFASRISKRINEVLEMDSDTVLRGANTLGTVAGELILQRSLEYFRVRYPLLGRIATDFSAEPCVFNKEINTRVVSQVGATAYNTSTGYAVENTTTTDVPITIDQHYSSQVSFNANEQASTFRMLFEEQVPAMIDGLAKTMCDQLLAIITTTNFTNITTAAAVDFDRTTVLEIGDALDTRGVPSGNRTLLLNGTYYVALMGDSAIVSLGSNQQSGIITGDTLPDVGGFGVLKVPALPTTGNLTGFALNKAALVIATRLPNDYSTAIPGATGGGVVGTVTDPMTGLSMMSVKFINHLLGASYMRFALMWGVAKGAATGGQFLRSSA